MDDDKNNLKKSKIANQNHENSMEGHKKTTQNKGSLSLEGLVRPDCLVGRFDGLHVYVTSHA